MRCCCCLTFVQVCEIYCDSNRFALFSNSHDPNRLFGLFDLFNLVQSIRCFQCSSDEDKSKDNCGAYEKFDTNKNTEVDCAGEDAVTPGI